MSLPLPESAEHRAEDFQQVPYPPPAALAETVPEPPLGERVWIDGEWAFRGKTYVWQRGGWIAPPSGARYAPWQFLLTPDGRLLYAPGTWYDSAGRRLERLEPVVPANTPPNAFTPERATAR